MLADFAGRIIEGFLTPRASARRLLDGGHGVDAIVLIFLLAFIVGSIFEVLLGSSQGSMISRHIATLVSSGAALAVTSFLACRLGRISGGTASMQDMFLVLSWHALVTSFLSPFIFGLREQMQKIALVAEEAAKQAAEQGGEMPEIVNMPEVGGGVLLAGLAAFGVSIWLLASYIAEAHEFKNTWGVLGVVVGLPMVFALLLLMLTGGA